MEKIKNIVITGSTRGIGRALAEEFIRYGCNVAITGLRPKSLVKAKKELKEFEKQILFIQCDVRKKSDLQTLWNNVKKQWKNIDIWVNNAGISQPDADIWDVPPEKIADLIATNITGMMYGTQTAMNGMKGHGFAQIFNMEGFGSDGMMMKKLTLYGTSKKALRYFTRSAAKEAQGSGVVIGALSPGMMITDFILKPLKNNPERAKQLVMIANIIADYPDTVARFLVPRMLKNKKQGVIIRWATRRKMFWRFLTAVFRKRKLISLDDIK